MAFAFHNSHSKFEIRNSKLGRESGVKGLSWWLRDLLFLAIYIGVLVGLSYGLEAIPIQGMAYYNRIIVMMGIMPGLKAFVAAVVGGIGNVPGAMIGGLIIGEIEAFVGGSQFSNYRDAIAFVILIVILLFRPSGLFGKYEPEKV